MRLGQTLDIARFWADGVYVPRNRPAIGNLMTAFDFGRPHFGTLQLGVRSEPAGGARPHVSYRLR